MTGISCVVIAILLSPAEGEWEILEYGVEASERGEGAVAMMYLERGLMHS